MLERKDERYLLWKLGRILREERQRPAAQQDKELIVTIKAAIEAVRCQFKDRSKRADEQSPRRRKDKPPGANQQRN